MDYLYSDWAGFVFVGLFLFCVVSSRLRLVCFFLDVLFYGSWSSFKGVSRLVCFFAYTEGLGKP